LNTTVLPNARAGAIFQAGMAAGKFQGVISPITPKGSRVTVTSTPARTEARLTPSMRSASPAKNLKIWPARAASPIPSAKGFPSSRDRRRPSSSLRARISVPMASRKSARTCGVAEAHCEKAALAAATAPLVKAASAAAYSPTISLKSEGLTSMIACLPAAHSPAM
jgi:hypothetical protein